MRVCVREGGERWCVADTLSRACRSWSRSARHRHGPVRVVLSWEPQPVPRRRADPAVSDRAGEPVQSLPVPLRGPSRQIRLEAELRREN